MKNRINSTRTVVLFVEIGALSSKISCLNIYSDSTSLIIYHDLITVKHCNKYPYSLES